MSELRRNPITGEWVSFAVKRGKRQYDFVKKSEPKADSHKTCPFCPGNEKETTKAVFQNKEDWSIRIFPNKYPAFDNVFEDTFCEDIYEKISGNGVHEVIVDTPNHFQKIHEFTFEHMLDVLNALKLCFDEISNNDFVKYVQIFKNNGPEAGMSIVHSHWQITGMPVMGKTQNDTLLCALNYKKEHNSCVMCDIIKHEIKINKRLIEENDGFISFVPYAPKMSYEVWIAPKKHISSFGEFKEDDMESLTKIFHNTVKRVAMINDDISYNICFMDSPKDENRKLFHWYIKIIPRMGNFAGLEFSSGTFINPVLPEDTAEFYKSKRV